MLFLVLLCSLASFSLAELKHFPQLKVHKDVDRISELWKVLANCDDDLDADAWTSLGIRKRDAGEGRFEINPETENEVASILASYDNSLTLRQTMELAKEQHPQLAEDIDNYVAVGTRPVLVYLYSAFFELVEESECIISGKCKEDHRKLYKMIVYAGKIVNFVTRMGEETNESYKETLQTIDVNINPECNYDCVVRKYQQVIAKCSKPNQPIITEATDTYPVGSDSYVSSN